MPIEEKVPPTPPSLIVREDRGERVAPFDFVARVGPERVRAGDFEEQGVEEGDGDKEGEGKGE